MPRVPALFPPSVRRLTTSCPACQGEISAYVSVRATDWENTSGGLQLSMETSHHIGPHACLPPEPAEDIMTAALDAITEAAQKLVNLGDGWRITPASESAGRISALHKILRESDSVIPLALATRVSVLVFAVDDMMIGLDQGRTAEQMWADLQGACVGVIAEAEAWRAGP